MRTVQGVLQSITLVSLVLKAGTGPKYPNVILIVADDLGTFLKMDFN
jgi:hypothetical protein